MTQHSNGYHHGDLRAAGLRALDEMIAEQGIQEVTLRALGRRIRVSHTALLYPFGSLKGLFTAFAAEGFDLMYDHLSGSSQEPFVALEMGIRYISFAERYPSHFRVMFDPGRLDSQDGALHEAQQRTMGLMRDAAVQIRDPDGRADAAAAVVAGWALMHGLVELARSGSLDDARIEGVSSSDLPALARRSGAMLYGSPPLQVTSQEPEPEA